MLKSSKKRARVTSEGRTSTLHRAMDTPHHKAVLAQADKAAESVPAGLPHRTHGGTSLTLVHIWNATENMLRPGAERVFPRRTEVTRPECHCAFAPDM